MTKITARVLGSVLHLTPLLRNSNQRLTLSPLPLTLTVAFARAPEPLTQLTLYPNVCLKPGRN